MQTTGEAGDRVFLTASSGVEIDTVEDLLRQAGLSPVRWADLPPGPLGRSLSEVLGRCVALIAVLADDASPSPGLLVDVGAAIGRDLPVILITTSPRTRTKLPAVLQELPAVNLGGDERAIGDRIVQTIKAYSDTHDEPHPLTQSPVREWDSEVERRVAASLQQIGIRVVGQFPANNRTRVDLAAWFPDIGAQLNPLLVEVAARRPNLQQRREALRRYLHDAQTFIGVLVTVEPNEPTWEFAEGTAIVTLGVDFLEDIEVGALARLLMDGRNQLFHQS
ncbi:hypothetical protein [Amycolatopsis echigonensis]|uniref:hypothetical protein n=1 Tax=Amycolatopsis echigonensis TaxID=2576905 RepID=UPI0011781D6C|nr:hypothetical protein [Amycolatopsis niigatensis]